VFLQLAPPRPQSRVTFGGTQMRNCSTSSGSPRSSTSGSGVSQLHDVLNTSRSSASGQAKRAVEDFQGASWAQRRTCASSPRTDVDRDMSGRPKKAKIGREMSGLTFVQSAGKRGQPLGSLEQSQREISANEYRLWSKISSQEDGSSVVILDDDDSESPLRVKRQPEIDASEHRLWSKIPPPEGSCSVVILEDDYDVESPLRVKQEHGIDAIEYRLWSKISSPENGSSLVVLDEDYDCESPLMVKQEHDSPTWSSLLKVKEDPRRWPSTWQTGSNRDHSRESSHCTSDLQHDEAASLLLPRSTVSRPVIKQECMPSSGLPPSAVYLTRLAATSDSRDQRGAEDCQKSSRDARSNQWWAFVHGVVSEPSVPG